jgi:HAMP domain-containing protein
VLIYTVSYQFVSRSIESWFDVKVEGALDAGLNLGRATLDAQRYDLANKVRLAAERLADRSEGRVDIQPLALERLREQLSAQDIAIVGSSGQIILSAGSSPRSLLPDRPSQLLLREARTTRVVSQLEGLEDDATAGSARVRALAYIPSTNFELAQQDRFLMATQQVPPSLAANALSVQSAFREYQQRALGREGLRKMYIGTLTLTLILAVFAALLLAMTLANQLARPLLLLAQGVREVAEGDLSAKPVFASRDELGGLTRSFADMTEQLSEARAMVERSVSQVESARANLQTILDNLTAGVIVFDREGRIDTARRASCACRCPPIAARRSTRCLGWTPSPARCCSASSCMTRAPRPASATIGRTPSSCRPRWTATRRRCSCAARPCRRARGSWSSTTSPRWCRRRAAPPGARWRGDWRTRSRTRSRRSSSRPSGCSRSSSPSSRAPTRRCSCARSAPSSVRCRR